jgi:hypothetical protein
MSKLGSVRLATHRAALLASILGLPLTFSQASAAIPLVALVSHGGTSVPLGSLTVLDPAFTINCPYSTGCTLIIESIGTIGFNTGGAQDWEICAKVDGSYYYGCVVQGLARTDPPTGLSTGNTRQVFTVAQGNHSAVLYGVTQAGQSTMVQWQATYYMYK